MRSFISGLAVIAALVAAFALVLGVGGSTATANVDGVSAGATTLDAGGTTLITLDLDDDDGSLQAIATSGTFDNPAGPPFSCTADGAHCGVTSGLTTGAVFIHDPATAAGSIDIVDGLVDLNGSGAGDVNDDCDNNCFDGDTLDGGTALNSADVIDGLVDDDNDGVGGPAVADVTNPLGTANQSDILAGGQVDVDEDTDFDGADDLVGTTAKPQDLGVVELSYTAVTPGPSTATLTFIQDANIGTLTLTVRGAATELEIFARSAPATATANAGVDVTYIREVNATVGQDDANINVSALDSAGNRLVGQTFVFVTTDGALAQNTVVAGAAQTWATTTLGDDATTDDGETVTVTVAAAGVTGTLDVSFAGNPSTCTFQDADGNAITSLGTSSGALAQFEVVWSDASGGPIPDRFTPVLDTDIQAVNPVGTGTFALVSAGASDDGVTSVSLAVGATGGTAVIGSAATTPCNLQVVVGEPVTPPPPPGPDGGDGAITGDLPSSGFGLVTFGGSIDQLTSALATACSSGAPIFATSGGAFVGFFPTTSLEAPNAAFNALFSGGIPANTPLLGGNC